ncbi:hypothetical protein [Candidatus Borrarchaeum sp.]|uniref:hypothetical protein n=1 Tax=Candidatus Borrarchaeum sp. TaxID=2846742 RepID=UPI00257A1C0B|nr:hypothetical protein [Candidatus Borrarchaeum sp.]
MADSQENKETDKKRLFRLYTLSLNYFMIFVLATGLFIGMFLAYLLFKPLQLYLYVAIASCIILIPSLVGFIRTYILAKNEVKLIKKMEEK